MLARCLNVYRHFETRSASQHDRGSQPLVVPLRCKWLTRPYADAIYCRGMNTDPCPAVLARSGARNRVVPGGAMLGGLIRSGLVPVPVWSGSWPGAAGDGPGDDDGGDSL